MQRDDKNLALRIRIRSILGVAAYCLQSLLQTTRQCDRKCVAFFCLFYIATTVPTFDRLWKGLILRTGFFRAVPNFARLVRWKRCILEDTISGYRIWSRSNKLDFFVVSIVHKIYCSAILTLITLLLNPKAMIECGPAKLQLLSFVPTGQGQKNKQADTFPGNLTGYERKWTKPEKKRN